MTPLDELIPTPRLLEVDHVDLAVPPQDVWPVMRHGDLARSTLARTLFAVRGLPGRLRGEPPAPGAIRIDDLESSPARPGFRVFSDDPPHEVTVGAIGKVWEPEIPFVHAESAEAFAAFAERDFAKVAWAVRVLPRGENGSRVELEVRVDATDDGAWRKFTRYFRVIGIGSRLIRRGTLAAIARELGGTAAHENERPLPGDELLDDATAQITQFVDITATPAAIWPWLVQMGGRRAGFYSIDVLDNAGERSARELHPEWRSLAVGDVIRSTPDGEDGFEVLRIERDRCLVVGGLFDPVVRHQLPFATPRPERFWQVTWAFVLEPLDARTTRLHARARAAFTHDQQVHVFLIRPAHLLMEKVQLESLAARVEGRLPPDDWRDRVEGIAGAAIATAALLTPFLRGARNHWGLEPALAERPYPGDALVPRPDWGWTHGIEIDAPVADVWPWVAQIGADRAGFYSYQWLENLAGCAIRNAEIVHPEWQLREGDELLLAPEIPPLRVVELVSGGHLVAHAGDRREDGKPWAEVTWLFLVEPLGPNRSRLISRYRCATSGDLKSRLTGGPIFIEPIGFAMDRRMLFGIKERAERSTVAMRHMPAAVSHSWRAR